MQERYLCTVDNVGGARSQILLEWCRICPNASYEMRWEVIDPKKWLWVKELVTQINSLFSDEWELVPHSRTVVDHKLHRRCIEIRYTFRFKKGAKLELPTAHAKQIMDLVEAAAPPHVLVTTTRKGKRDFCDWGWNIEGEAWLAIYIQK